MNDDPRPPTIAHLAKMALDNLWDDSKELKYWLRMAEKLRKEAHVHYDDGDLQSAFVKFARAATLVMELLPGHRDFNTLLTDEHRHNLNLNGIHMMETMQQIKPILLQRVVDWDHAHGVGETQVLPSADKQLDDKPETGLRKAALLAAQKAAAAGDEERIRRQRLKEDEERERMLRQQEEERARHLRQQEEMRQREEEIRRKKEQERRQHEAVREPQERRQHEPRETMSANNPAAAPSPFRETMSANNPAAAPSPFQQPYRPPLQSPATLFDDDSPRPQPASFRGGSILYPSPITTAALPPAQARIQYPPLMSQHQQRQGYQPALDNTPRPPPSRPAPPLPPPPRSAQPLLTTDGLRQVHLPRECLSRFIGIALVNTSKNLETCGLLLGHDRGQKYAVTTLLIPKQHATSDTCAMDEEELVMHFTEARQLITLGWIHTHPSQSCFMSSVDLHTHAGFQRMLRESFAVVCAPNSNPNFGIFRLTDPPGLDTVLKCQVKEAFHPHPDLPIYTDADKSHVLMKDLPLEIVDLR